MKRRVREIIKSLGKDAVYCMPMGTGYGNSGVGDFIFCYQGKYHEIECKAGGNTLTALQEKRQRDVGDAGGRVITIDEHNVINLKEWIAGE